MKIIFKLSIVLVFAVIISSCTDEKDFIDNKPSKANKNLEEELIRRPYYQYEQYDISPEELYDDLVEFADAINEGIEMPILNINKALLLMETFFNYAIVDKQEIYDTSISYENTVFTFTVDLGEEDMIENPNQLRQNFQAFIEDVRAEMGNKYMQFSDLYVLEKDYNFITFALEMPSFENIDAFPVGPRCQVIMRDNDLSWLPYHIELEWGSMLQYTGLKREKFLERLCQETKFGFNYGFEKTEFTPSTLFKENMNYNSVIDNSTLRNEVLPLSFQYFDCYRSSSKPEISRVELLIEKHPSNSQGYDMSVRYLPRNTIFCNLVEGEFWSPLLDQIIFNN